MPNGNADANSYMHSVLVSVQPPQTKSKYLSIKQQSFTLTSFYFLLPYLLVIITIIGVFVFVGVRQVCVYAHSIVLRVCAVSMERTDLILSSFIVRKKKTISFEPSLRISKQYGVKAQSAQIKKSYMNR